MPNLADVTKDVQAFYGIPTEQAERFVDNLTPVVILQNIEAPFQVVRNDRSLWTAQAQQLGVASQLSAVWLFNPDSSGIDIVVSRMRFQPNASPITVKIGRLAGDNTFLGTHTSVPADQRNPNISQAKVRVGTPASFIFSKSNAVIHTGGSSTFTDMDVPFTIQPNESYGIQLQSNQIDLKVMVAWEERAQLSR